MCSHNPYKSPTEGSQPPPTPDHTARTDRQKPSEAQDKHPRAAAQTARPTHQLIRNKGGRGMSCPDFKRAESAESAGAPLHSTHALPHPGSCKYGPGSPVVISVCCACCQIEPPDTPWNTTLPSSVSRRAVRMVQPRFGYAVFTALILHEIIAGGRKT